jgi:dolichol kinase
MLDRLARKIVHWLFVAVLMLYGVTGLGITNYRIVEPATLGLLSKPLAFMIHDNLLVPFLILLALHIWQMLGRNRQVKC